ncbi:zinc ribbon domain-containing protein [Halalkalicoccus sp. NIPERK01]|uniref:double zinc ribbon domain-containing protein n=1 Tax=Halalkalicoccus sp. NIPERK01 TaxID=3053469 RepID=UPI00256F4590|nr:zinc ribbon domain-containing protein [Halalkalicoccus sp. NIPERK01]MDL5361655.1 zinc ribbon domain-containing protein [Halalkalicoccus sp. NIPERK01]
MSKITFRADDDLVARIEAMDASKSEVMREALRAYLGSAPADSPGEDSLDTLITDRIDRRIADRLDDRLATDVNVTVTVEDDRIRHDDGPAQTPQTVEQAPSDPPPEHHCVQCGETVDDDHVYCPNCGEKADTPALCECGVELRTDWAFCPSCGRRTPAADVLDR